MKNKNGKLQKYENKKNSNKSAKTQIIQNILKEKRKDLFKKRTVKKKEKLKEIANKGLKGYSSETESENDGRAQSVRLPELCGHKWNRFKKALAEQQPHENIQKMQKSRQKCLDRMNSYQMFPLHFTAVHFIRKAIVDSLLSRKWDNLVKLLVMMIKNYYDPVFTVFIRHMCEILKHYHPKIQGTELEDQIELIVEKAEKLRNSRLNVTN